MKSLFYLSLMAAGMLAVHANGKSLYTPWQDRSVWKNPFP